MAGDWTKIEHALPDKPEVAAMSVKLGIDEDWVVGKLLRLWRWVDVQAEIRANLDGHVSGVDNDWIDRQVKCEGFADALRSVKWLRNKRGGIIFPNIGKHLGEGAKARAGEAVRKRMQRKNCPDICPDPEKSIVRTEKIRKEKGSAVHGEISQNNSACHARETNPIRLLRAVEKIQKESDVSNKRTSEVIAAIRVIDDHQDALAKVTEVLDRSRKLHVNPIKRGGYVAEALIKTAKQLESQPPQLTPSPPDTKAR